ncbi:MAG: hypothetical protein K1W00_00225 [Lachnospiraceae bacterium]
MTWTKEKATKYKNDFIKETYDRVNLTIPKGKKAIVTEYAKSRGLSLNAYINKLIADDMGEALTIPNKQQGD